MRRSEAGILDPVRGRRRSWRTRFRHALLREAAYDDLLPAERVRLHARGGRRTLRRPSATTQIRRTHAIVADYALQAYQAHDLPRALEGSCQGTVGADRQSMAYREALAHAERALELWPRVDDAEQRAGIDHADLLAPRGRDGRGAERAGACRSPLRQGPRRARGPIDTDVRVRVGLLIELQLDAWEAEDYEVSRSRGRGRVRVRASGATHAAQGRS